MYLREIDINEIKQIELEMLIEFDAFCKKNNLRYYLAGGTLLGAIRHKGFIPWDDDIDLVMPREDYNKLLDMEKNVLSDDMSLITWRNGSIYPFIKIINNKTLVYEYMNNKPTSVWIDIFPIDKNPEDQRINRKFYKQMFYIRKSVEMSNARFGTGSSKLKTIRRSILHPFFSLIGTKKLCELTNKYAQKYKDTNSKYIGCVVWGYGEKEKVREDSFFKAIQVEFEGHLFPAPSSYDEYLTNLYGDYMKLPPVGERVTRHDIKAYRKEEVKGD